MFASDPAVFVAGAQTSDVTKLGRPYQLASSGSGAGLSRQDALNAALGECVERYCAGVFEPANVLFGAYRSLADNHRLVAPGEFALYDLTQTLGPQFTRFTADVELSWMPATELHSGDIVFVPASLVCMPYSRLKEEIFLSVVNSTGLAAGRTLKSAVMSGVCEAIERDAFMICWRGRLPIPSIAVSAGHWLQRILQERFFRPHLEYRFFDTTLDAPLPSVFGILIDHSRSPAARLSGGACHFDPAIAILKTAIELVQGLKWIDFMQPAAPVADTYDKVTTYEDRVALYGFSDMTAAFDFLQQNGEKPLEEMRRCSNAPFGRSELTALGRELAGIGLRMYCAELTTADAEEAGLHVVRVITPGAENIEGDHRLPWLGGSRWREVPMRCDLASRPLELADVNPHPHPYP